MDKINKTLFKTIDGTEVFLREDGKFEAKIGGKTVTKRALADIEKELRKGREALVAYEIGHHTRSLYKVEILSFENGRARLKEDGRLAKGYTRYYIIDEATLESLLALKNQIEALEEIWTQKVNSLEQVRDRNFEEIRSRKSLVK